MSDESTAELVYRQLQVISLAMIAGTLVFGAAVVGLGLAGMAASGSIDLPIRLGAAAFGVVMLGLAEVLGRTLTRVPRGTDTDEAIQRLRSGTIVGQALRESVGLAGVVAGYLTGDYLLMAVLLAAAVVAMLLGLPSRDRVLRLLRSGGR